MMCRTAGAQRQHERGQGLVEFALMLPLLLLFVFGIFEFGNVFKSQIELQNATREGARVAGIEWVGNGGTSSGVQSDVIAKMNATSPGLGFSSSTVTISPSSLRCSGSNTEEVTVSGSFSYQEITPAGSFIKWFSGSVLNSPISLSSSAVAHVEC